MASPGCDGKQLLLDMIGTTGIEAIFVAIVVVPTLDVAIIFAHAQPVIFIDLDAMVCVGNVGCFTPTEYNNILIRFDQRAG